ncbi:hypothetical protein [Halopiger aswanensis]|uniref:Uncharacterized protein n=1 Tax=Halopiger aswanensis TaxID=148449 RepID=A0A419WE03_9EURY|nr:hypothetical protein [Halopiger aswanensis]RKD93711.1 hypothetical protein ATJ93_3343 [Halopiger aswanensis]
MKRALALGFALLEILVPRYIVTPAERLAFRNPAVGRLRPSTIPIARLEGVLFAWLLLRGRGLSRPLRAALVTLGTAMALLPRTAVESGLALAYENPGELELKPWVVPVTRLLGAVYLIAGFVAGRAETPTDGTDRDRRRA